MANENNGIIQGMIDGVSYLIDDRLKKAPNDRTFQGKITNIDGTNLYSVSVNGRIYTNVKSLADTALSVNDIVYVVFPQNNPNNMFILNTGGSNAPAGATDYAQLSNKPSINGVELVGNKTAEQLNISEDKYVFTQNSASLLGMYNII